MGAQKSSRQEVDIVVDISRGTRAPSSAIGGKMVAVGNEADADAPHVDDHPSSGTTDGKPDVVDATASQGDGDKDVTSRPDEPMEDVAHEGLEEGSPKTESTVAHATNGNAGAGKNGDAAPMKSSEVAAQGVESPVKDSGDSIVSNGLPQDKDRERLMKNGGSRKRKKTIHYINSRVPHSRAPNAAAPALESEEGSDGQDSPEEADDVPVRPSQAPRAAATKLRSMVPVGDKLLKAPRNAKELMATRLLEGHFVRCSCRGIQLTGMLKDMGVQCDCRNCRGSVVVSISAFEAHSGSTSHHPSDNIYLENGKNLRDILSAGQEAADCGDNILRALKMAIGDIQGLERRKIACAKCGSSDEAGDFIPCKGPRCSLVFHSGCIGIPNVQLGDWCCPKCDKTKKPAVTKAKRPSSGGIEREEARVKEKDSARVARDAHLHKALFLPGGLEDDTELGYYTQTKCKLRGVKQGEGILCSCCQKKISCAEFEQHAGCEARQNPYASILLMTDGRSLKEVCKDLTQQNKLGDKAKRVAREGELNTCYECGNNGELKCNVCDQSWCADHQGGEKDSEGKWLCRFCRLDNLKVVKNGQKVSGNPMEGTNEKDERGRVIRHLQAPASVGGCAICKKWNLSESGYVQGMTMLVCDQCGREYHVSCLKGSGADDLNELPEGEWFCRKDCKVIDEILTQLVANGPESLSESIISELLESRQQQRGAKEKAETSSPSFGWQILCGKGGSTANVQTLAEAASIFTECSDPIRDKNGKNLIPPMVHSRRSKDYDFEGVFCVVLKLNDKVVSAALLQIFGREIAEVPLVATSLPHQGQGFCKALMTTIERLLGVLSVERLILPTAQETESIWINKFGFRRMDEEVLASICTTIRLMTFTGTCMLGKEITPMTV